MEAALVEKMTSTRKPVQTPLCIRPDVVRPVEFDGYRQGLHLIQQIEEWVCGRCPALPWWGFLCHLCTVVTADVTVNLGSSIWRDHARPITDIRRIARQCRRNGSPRGERTICMMLWGIDDWIDYDDGRWAVRRRSV